MYLQKIKFWSLQFETKNIKTFPQLARFFFSVSAYPLFSAQIFTTAFVLCGPQKIDFVYFLKTNQPESSCPCAIMTR